MRHVLRQKRRLPVRPNRPRRGQHTRPLKRQPFGNEPRPPLNAGWTNPPRPPLHNGHHEKQLALREKLPARHNLLRLFRNRPPHQRHLRPPNPPHSRHPPQVAVHLNKLVPKQKSDGLQKPVHKPNVLRRELHPNGHPLLPNPPPRPLPLRQPQLPLPNPNVHQSLPQVLPRGKPKSDGNPPPTMPH